MARETAAFEFQGDELPTTWKVPSGRHGFEAHVYVIGFRTGLVKVGYSRYPRGRVVQHASTARAHGDAINRVWISPPHRGTLANERHLIRYCTSNGTPVSGNEYFTNVSPEKIIRFAKSLTFERSEHGLPEMGDGLFLVKMIEQYYATRGRTAEQVAELDELRERAANDAELIRMLLAFAVTLFGDPPSWEAFAETSATLRERKPQALQFAIEAKALLGVLIGQDEPVCILCGEAWGVAESDQMCLNCGLGIVGPPPPYGCVEGWRGEPEPAGFVATRNALTARSSR